MVEEEKIESLRSRREKSLLNFAKKNRETERFKSWFPEAPTNRLVRPTTHRKYQEARVRTERSRNNPIQAMIRALNAEEL